LFYKIEYMKKILSLGDFEQVMILAILRIQTQGAYGLAIREVITEKTSRKPTPSAVYTTLERLEDKGLVRSEVGESTPERGGRAKRYFYVTAEGEKAIRNSQQELQRLSHGLDLWGEAHA
jgi:DNA-binding PadR family transcriptional regulator